MRASRRHALLDRVRALVAVAAVAVATSVGTARADGGLVRGSVEQAGLVVTLFTSPTPLRAGNADVSVLVQDAASGAAVLDATVTLRIEPEVEHPQVHEHRHHQPHEGGATAGTVRLTREAATNKLLQAATVRFATPGRTRLIAEARRGSARAAVVATVTVAEPQPPLLALWPYLALPPLVVGIFVVHQILRRRAARAPRTTLTAAASTGGAA